MSSNKPLCTNYILHVARSIRRNPANIMPGRNAGIQLKRIYDFVRHQYQTDEIHAAIDELILSGTIIVLARYWLVTRIPSERRYDRSRIKTVILDNVSRDMITCTERLCLDYKGKKVDVEKVDNFVSYSRLHLHIVHDGLCGEAQREFSKKFEPSLSQKLLDSTPTARLQESKNKTCWKVIINAEGRRFSSEPLSREFAEHIRACFGYKTVKFQCLTRK